MNSMYSEGYPWEKKKGIVIRHIPQCIKARIRLRKIEKATGIKLYKWQRQIVLCDDTVYVYGKRKSGKTITAVFWTLMWREDPIYINRERMKLDGLLHPSLRGDQYPAIPDPDAIDCRSLDFTISEYVKYAGMCREHGIKVAEVKRR